MAESQHAGHLGAVYDAGKPEDVAALYDAWATTYDAEMAKFGYRHPAICLALLSRHLPRGAAPLLDAGAGTGLVGEWLALVGYPDVEALDISPGMLAVAAQKKCYRKLHHLALGGTLPFAHHSYAGIISTGVFTTGHVGAEALDELVRICRPGGVIVLTVKNPVWDAGFIQRIEAFEHTGVLTRVEETLPYVSMPGEANVVPSRAVVLKVT
jgi:predicted TPR repeat methyltransferase